MDVWFCMHRLSRALKQNENRVLRKELSKELKNRRNQETTKIWFTTTTNDKFNSSMLLFHSLGYPHASSEKLHLVQGPARQAECRSEKLSPNLPCTVVWFFWPQCANTHPCRIKFHWRGPCAICMALLDPLWSGEKFCTGIRSKLQWPVCGTAMRAWKSSGQPVSQQTVHLPLSTHRKT